MGTPEFAVASLRAIVEAGYKVVGVVTAPDKPAGRGRKLKESDVKVYAKSQNLQILQPTNLKNEDFLEKLRALRADLQVIVAFRMLPVVVWDMPPLGSINVHGSLLPNYRGAAPIHWAVINGEKETGVSTFFLKQEIDTGNIIGQAKTDIEPDNTTGEIYYKLMHLGAKLLLETLENIEKEDYKEIPQELSLTAYTALHGKVIKIHSSKLIDSEQTLKPGEITIANKQLLVGTGSQPIQLIGLQMEGKQRSSANDFINAYLQEEGSYNFTNQ
jgi:methionyl-tRNA formyltransferase